MSHNIHFATVYYIQSLEYVKYPRGNTCKNIQQRYKYVQNKFTYLYTHLPYFLKTAYMEPCHYFERYLVKDPI